MESDVIALVEAAARTQSDYDIGCAIAHMFAGRFRYVGCSDWEQWDIASRSWTVDARGGRLIAEARRALHAAAVARALHWQLLANAHGAVEDDANERALSSTMEARAEALLALSQRAQDEAHLRPAIKEARAFLDEGGKADRLPRRKRL